VQRVVKAKRAGKPIPTDTEVAFVAATLMVNEMTQALLHDPTAQRRQPNKGKSDSEHHAPQIQRTGEAREPKNVGLAGL
jgi:hypothetical protein